MIAIRTRNNKSFDLFPDTKLSIEETSPFFGKNGSFSLPLDLPATDNNLAILEYPYRLDRRKKFIKELDVIASAGTWSRHARMSVESSSRDGNISATLFFGESKFYRLINEKKLPDIFKDKKETAAGKNTNEKVSNLVSKLNRVMCGDAIADYFVFPILCGSEQMTATQSDGVLQGTSTWTRFLILNRPDVPRKNKSGTKAVTHSGAEYYTLAEFSHKYNPDNTTFSYPPGYGHTPFLKFTFVLRYLFSHLGYTLEQSIFDTDDSFQNLCLLNNTADAIVKGEIFYEQLVPDVDISAFLEFVENTFGCEFLVNEKYKTVTPLFWKDFAHSSAAAPLKNYEDFPSVELSSEKSIKLTFTRPKEEQPTIHEFKTYPEIFKRYGSYNGSFADMDALRQAIVQETISRGVYFIRGQRMFHVVFKRTPDLMNPANYHWVNLPIAPDTLDYYDVDASEFDDRPMGFELPAIVPVPLRGETAPILDVSASNNIWAGALGAIYKVWEEMYGTNNGIIAKIPTLAGVRHLNSVIRKTETKGDEKTVTLEEERADSFPILPCLHVGLRDKIVLGGTHRNSGSFDISAFSLYNRFWQHYDNILKSSFHSISGRARMSEQEIASIDFGKSYNFDGQPVLIESIRYEMGKNGVEVLELKCRTLKIYE